MISIQQHAAEHQPPSRTHPVSQLLRAPHVAHRRRPNCCVRELGVVFAALVCLRWVATATATRRVEEEQRIARWQHLWAPPTIKALFCL